MESKQNREELCSSFDGIKNCANKANLSEKLNLLLLDVLRQEYASQAGWSKFERVSNGSEWEQEAVQNLMAVLQTKCAALVKSGIESVLDNPLENSLVLDRLFSFASPEELKSYRLVCRSWNREATLHFQKRRTIYLTAPCNAKTRQFFGLAEQFHELENSFLEWPFTSVLLRVEKNCKQNPLPDLITILQSISSFVKSLCIRFDSDLETWAEELMPGIAFDKLVHFDCQASNCGKQHNLQAWVIKQSPKLTKFSLKLDHQFVRRNEHAAVRVSAAVWWPLLPLMTNIQNLKLESLEVGAFCYQYHETMNFYKLYDFLSSQGRFLKGLVMHEELRLPYPFDPVPTCLNLVRMKAWSENAIGFLENPRSLPNLNYLEFNARSYFELWIQRWNGQPVLSVETLIFGKWFKKDFNYSKMARLFPNVRRLEFCNVMPSRDAFFSWVVGLEHLKDLTLNFETTQSFYALFHKPHPAYNMLEFMRIYCSTRGGPVCLRDEVCRNVFLKLNKLKRLELQEEMPVRKGKYARENGQQISPEIVEERSRKFSFQYTKILTRRTRKFYTTY